MMYCYFASSRARLGAMEADATANASGPDRIAHSLEDLACISAQLGLLPLASAASAAAETGEGASRLPSLRAALAAAEENWAALDVSPSQLCPPPVPPPPPPASSRPPGAARPFPEDPGGGPARPYAVVRRRPDADQASR